MVGTIWSLPFLQQKLVNAEIDGGIRIIMYTITLNIPKEVMGLYGSESEFADYVSMVIAKDLYKNMGVSAMHCAKIVRKKK